MVDLDSMFCVVPSLSYITRLLQFKLFKKIVLADICTEQASNELFNYFNFNNSGLGLT